MKRLLCITANMNAGGAETFLMKIYRTLDKTKYQMDFIVSENSKNFYEDEILSYGGKFHRIPPKSKSPIKSFFAIKKIVKKEKYEYVMRVNEHSLSTIDLLAAKLGGAKKLIMRSSNSNSAGSKVNKILHKAFAFLPKNIPDVKIAPSSEAAIYTFGKKQLDQGKVILLNNAIPYEKYKYNNDDRLRMRKELGIENKLVIGHIGRFNEQKNHTFLLDIFAKIKKYKEDAVLMLIGDGILKSKIEEKMKKLKIDNDVILLGVRDDVPQILMAMDIFVFPSLFEGMPNTVIEAQASGLKCIVSDTITRESNITGLVEYISIQKGAEFWSDVILNNIAYERKDKSKDFIRKGYDINDVVKRIEQTIFEDVNNDGKDKY